MAQESSSVIRRLVSVVTEPVAVFKAIVDQPQFMRPALVLCALNILMAVVLLPKIRAATMWMIENGALMIPSSELGRIKELLPVTIPLAALFGAALFPIVVWLLVALLLRLFGSLRKTVIPFESVLTIAVYGYVPILLGNVVSTGIALSSPVENFHRTTVNLAMFLPYSKTLAYTFLARCSVFTLWSLALWSIGGAVAFKARSRYVAVYLFALWLLYTLLSSLALLSRP
ncbi:MAG: YIP1 family protein [Bacillota bacterium]